MPRFVAIMGEIYRVTPRAWERYCRAFAAGERPELSPLPPGWTFVCSDPVSITDWEPEDAADELRGNGLTVQSAAVAS